MLGYVRDGRPMTFDFGRDFVKQYKELGLRLEPQGVDGEVSYDAALVFEVVHLPKG